MNINKDIQKFLKHKIDKLKSETINLNDMRFKDPSLFHGSKIEHAAANLKRGYSIGRTQQRYWDDGRVLKDDHEDYYKSGWMYGWSMTREKNFAGQFSDVLFIFDKNKVKSKFKVKTLSWSYRVSQGAGYFRREREDYVIAGKDPRTDQELKDGFEKYLDDQDEKYDQGNRERNKYEDRFQYQEKDFNKNKLIMDSSTIRGFLISDSIIEIFGKDDEDIQYLLNHELCLGVYDYEKAKKSMHKQKNPSPPKYKF